MMILAGSSKPASSSTPSVILAHDAFHHPAHYLEFRDALSSIGLNKIRIPQLPSSGSSVSDDNAFAHDVALLHRTISTDLKSGQDVIILAHGYGGIPVCEALRALPPDPPKHSVRSHGRVLGIIFIAAIVAEKGESWATAQPQGMPDWIKFHGRYLIPARPGETFFNTLPPTSELAKDALRLITPQAPSSIHPLTICTWSKHSCAYIRCCFDKSLRIPDQDHMLFKLRQRAIVTGETVEVRDIRSDHEPFTCMPNELAVMVKGIVDQFRRLRS